MILAISEALGRFPNDIEENMDADDFELWAAHLQRKNGGLQGMTMGDMTARLRAGGARQL